MWTSRPAASVLRCRCHCPPAMYVTMASAVSSLHPTPPRLHYPTTAVSALRPTPPRLHYPATAASASPCALPFRRRLSLTTACAVLSRDYFSPNVPILTIDPANENKSIYKITLDLTDHPDLVEWYKNPGQLVQASAPTSKHGAFMEIASEPHAVVVESLVPYFDLLVRSVPGTTAEELCNLKPKDEVGLLPVFWEPGWPIQLIKDSTTVLYFAVAEGLSPIRALLRSGYTKNVKFYYGARNQESLPLESELEDWKKAGIDVTVVKSEPAHYDFLRNADKIITDPASTVAIMAGPMNMQQHVTKVLNDHKVTYDRILKVKGWYPNY